MKQLPNSLLLCYNDASYIHAINYHHCYNAPITLNYGEKHNRKKYMLGCGTSDNIELWQDGIFIYVLGQNNGLGYISLEVINTEIGEVENKVFLDDADCNDEGNLSYGILDMPSQDQLKVLFNYL